MKRVKKRLKKDLCLSGGCPPPSALHCFVQMHAPAKGLRFSPEKIKRFAVKILKLSRVSGAQLSIIVADRSLMRRLNTKFSGRRVSTDVLAFRLSPAHKKRGGLMADIIVSLDAARTNAKTYGCSVEEELSRYIVHGVLHLLGDNDATPEQARKMWRRQEALLKKAGSV